MYNKYFVRIWCRKKELQTEPVDLVLRLKTTKTNERRDQKQRGHKKLIKQAVHCDDLVVSCNNRRFTIAIITSNHDEAMSRRSRDARVSDIRVLSASLSHAGMWIGATVKKHVHMLPHLLC